VSSWIAFFKDKTLGVCCSVCCNACCSVRCSVCCSGAVCGAVCGLQCIGVYLVVMQRFLKDKTLKV